MQPLAEITFDKTRKTYHPEEYHEMIKIWQSQIYEPVQVDYSTCFQENPALLAVLNNSPCVTKIIDLRTLQFDFVSSNAAEVLGYDKSYFFKNGLAFCNTIVHPEDLQKNWKMIKHIWNFILSLPPANYAQYKFNYDYRIIKPDGKEIRILAQNSVLQSDRKGNITHVLGVYSDITHWKKCEQQIASIVSTAHDTCIFITPENTDITKQEVTLSKRELQIVKLVAEGYSSKIIAEKLFISFHTVNTHRQKIIEKTQMRNTGGLVQFAFSHGLI